MSDFDAYQQAVTCRFTGSWTHQEEAHVVPKGEINWYTINNMSARHKGSNQGASINDNSNLIPLRPDVHSMFDNHVLTLFPMPTSRDAQGNVDRYELLLHTLHPRGIVKSTSDFTEIYLSYHSRRIHPIPWVDPVLLFARFAWSLFSPITMKIMNTSLKGEPLPLAMVQAGLGGTLEYQIERLLPNTSGASNQATSNQVTSQNISQFQSTGFEQTAKRFHNALREIPDDTPRPNPNVYRVSYDRVFRPRSPESQHSLGFVDDVFHEQLSEPHSDNDGSINFDSDENDHDHSHISHESKDSVFDKPSRPENYDSSNPSSLGTSFSSNTSDPKSKDGSGGHYNDSSKTIQSHLTSSYENPVNPDHQPMEICTDIIQTQEENDEDNSC
ncbi:hypothetical protein ABKA04_005649 [Annulohypoxylon sp. FPYF3050]